MQPRAGSVAGVDFVGSFVAAAERFADAVAARPLDAPVPTCPGWTSYDLVVHLGNVHAWAATIVETGRPAATQNDEPASHRKSAVSQWYAGKAEDLYAVLRTADLEAGCWNFVDEHGRAGFWSRRQAHETTMHLVDLLGAEPIDPALAADGVAEVFEVFLPRMHARGTPTALTAPVCCHATDTAHWWTLTPAPLLPDATTLPVQGGRAAPVPVPVSADAPRVGPPTVVPRRHPRADRVEGSADSLVRMFWKRLPYDDDAIVRAGDLDRLDAFLGSRLTP